MGTAGRTPDTFHEHVGVVGSVDDSLIENKSKPKLRIISKGEDPKNYLYRFKNKITSLEQINKTASGIGSISLLESVDGIIRSVPILLNIDDQIWPSLSLESIRAVSYTHLTLPTILLV